MICAARASIYRLIHRISMPQCLVALEYLNRVIRSRVVDEGIEKQAHNQHIHTYI